MPTRNHEFSRSFRALLRSNWQLEATALFDSQSLTEDNFVLRTGAVSEYVASILGPVTGTDPYGLGLNSYSPNYSAFYTPLTSGQYSALTGRALNTSSTRELIFRTQLTNPALLRMRSGDVGVALVGEIGLEGWAYHPDPGIGRGDFLGFTAVGDSSADRNRQALTAEMRSPLTRLINMDISGRFDRYRYSSQAFQKPTFNLGIEYAPLSNLAVHGRVGVAFRAPSLADEAQGLSGAYGAATDFYKCVLAGFSIDNTLGCPYPLGGLANLLTVGNPDLQPTTASTTEFGVRWSPVSSTTIDVGVRHWAIRDEVHQKSVVAILRLEAECRLGLLPADSMACREAISEVTRSPVSGASLSVLVPKINVSREDVTALTASVMFEYSLGGYGDLHADFLVNDTLKHTRQVYPDGLGADVLALPFLRQEFKVAANGTLTWTRNAWSHSLSSFMQGTTPNYIAANSINGYAAKGAGDLPEWWTFNWSSSYQFSPRLQLAVSVANVLNAMPPVDPGTPGYSSVPFNSLAYNAYGRMFRASLRYGIRQ